MTPVRTMITEDVVRESAVRGEAGALVDRALDRTIRSMSVELDDGSTLQLPARLTRFLANLLHSVAAGATISTVSLPPVLTTTTAAQELGVSRPTLMKMIAAGDLPFTKVGSHTRLRRDDVSALRARRQDERRAAAQAVLRAGEAFD